MAPPALFGVTTATAPLSTEAVHALIDLRSEHPMVVWDFVSSGPNGNGPTNLVARVPSTFEHVLYFAEYRPLVAIGTVLGLLGLGVAVGRLTKR